MEIKIVRIAQHWLLLYATLNLLTRRTCLNVFVIALFAHRFSEILITYFSQKRRRYYFIINSKNFLQSIFFQDVINNEFYQHILWCNSFNWNWKIVTIIGCSKMEQYTAQMIKQQRFWNFFFHFYFKGPEFNFLCCKTNRSPYISLFTFLSNGENKPIHKNQNSNWICARKLRNLFCLKVPIYSKIVSNE